MNLFFSIIIPVHNRAHTLVNCVNSMLSQTYHDFELILVDDHSTDNSLDVARELAKKDSRIKVLEQNAEKRGAQAARNTGIKNAKYDWIMFNDSDDAWVLDKIQKEVVVLERYNYDEWLVVYSDCNTIDVRTNEKKYWALPHISIDNSYKDLLVQSGPMFQSLLCSKKHLEEIGLLDEAVPSYQEWDTSIRLAKNGRFAHVQEPLFDYYIGANDAISKSPEKDFVGRCNIYNKFKDEIIRLHGSKKYKYMICQNILRGDNINFFKRLKDENSIISCFGENVFSFFGADYEKNILLFMKRYDECICVRNKIGRGVVKVFKAPVRLFKSLFIKK